MAKKSPVPLIDRFLAKVMPEPNTGCWLWIGACSNWGYGNFRIGRQQHRTHRAAWILFVGPIPDGADVLHRCDVRPCVNPEHLFLGDQILNVQDRDRKGRQARGERQHLAKLTEADVHAIRGSRRTGKALAADYHVAETTISRVRRRLTWRHI